MIFPVMNGHVLIDEADLHLVRGLPWKLDSKGYARAYLGDRRYVIMHRLLTDAPAGMIVDHANRVTHDNRRANLRIGTRSDNAQNLSTVGRGRSAHRGVTFSEKTGKWMARCGVRGERRYLGLFDTEAAAGQAAAAYRAAHMPFSPEAAAA